LYPINNEIYKSVKERRTKREKGLRSAILARRIHNKLTINNDLANFKRIIKNTRRFSTECRFGLQKFNKVQRGEYVRNFY
jgi:hypothetical protein